MIEAFLTQLSERGRLAKRNSLSRQDYSRALKIGWPTHDQHLLAAGLEGSRTTIFVTEDAHARCSAALRRQFHLSVVQL